MRGTDAPLVHSERITSDARKFLDVIDQILMLDYLKPDLRRRVVQLQRRLIQAELAVQDHAVSSGSDR